MKKLICVVAALVLLLSLSLTAAAESEQYTIGIAQFAEHGSLDNCREGFLMGLAEAGIVEGENLTIDYQIAQQFVSNNVDLMCAIATPVAQACYNAADGNIPTIYTAVTDPVAAMLAGEDGSPVGNATGTSDKLPVENQLKAIRAIMPEAKKIGILYTTSEVNSESAIAEYQALAPEYGFEIVTSGISTTADIPMALDSLLSQVDVMTNLTDNTVVSALSLVLDKANAANIPVFGSEIEQVKLGCVASEGLDYIALGKRTGAMAAKVLKGEATCQDLPYEVISESSLYVNYEAMEALGLTLPEDMAARAIDVNAEAAAE